VFRDLFHRLLAKLRSNSVLLIVLFCVCSLLPFELESECAIAAALLAILHISKLKESMSPVFFRWLLVCFGHLIFYVLVAALGRDKWSNTELLLQSFVFVPFAYVAMSKSKSLPVLYAGFALYAAWCFGDGLYDLSIGIARPDQNHNAAVFGCFLAGLASIFFLPIFYFSGLKRWASALFCSLAFASLCFTQTRGAILAFFASSAGISMIYPRVRKAAVCTGLLIAIIGGLAFSFGTDLKPVQRLEKRFVKAANEVQAYYRDDHYKTSVGTRLALWESAWREFLQRPVFGGGHLLIKDKRSKSSNEKERYLSEFYHAHNGYLEALSSSGLVGFVVMMFAYVFPLFFFWRNMRRENIWAAVGLQFTILYLALNFTDYAIRDRLIAIQYFFLISVFLTASEKHADHYLTESTEQAAAAKKAIAVK